MVKQIRIDSVDVYKLLFASIPKISLDSNRDLTKLRYLRVEVQNHIQSESQK